MPSAITCAPSIPDPASSAGEITRASDGPAEIAARTSGMPSRSFHCGGSGSSIYMKASVDSGAADMPART